MENYIRRKNQDRAGHLNRFAENSFLIEYQKNNDEYQDKRNNELFDKNRRKDLLLLFEKIVICASRTPDLRNRNAEQIWNYLYRKEEDIDIFINYTRLSFIDYENFSKILIYFLCGRDEYLSLCRKMSEETKGLGYIINNASYKTIDKIPGLFNKDHKDILNTMRRYRNTIAHGNTNGNTNTNSNVYESGPENTIANMESCLNSYIKLSNLVFTCQLLALDWHYEHYLKTVDEILKEHPEYMNEEGSSGSSIEDYESAYFKALAVRHRRELASRVGNFGIIENEELKVIPMELQKKGNVEAFESYDDEQENSDDINGENKKVEEVEGKEEREDSETTRVEKIFIEDLLETEERVNVILGNPGAGKTTALLHILGKYLDKYNTDGDVSNSHDSNYTILPIRINLSEVTNGDSVVTFIQKSLNMAFNIDHLDSDKREFYQYVNSLVQKGRVIFLIDGLNELKVPSFLGELINYIIENDKARFYITGRIHEFHSVKKKFETITDMAKYHVCEISFDDHIKSFLQKLNVDDTIIKRFLDNNVKSLLDTPLNFVMITGLLLKSNKDSMPSVSNRGELLDEFMKFTIADSGINTPTLDDYRVEFKVLQELACKIFITDTDENTISKDISKEEFIENVLTDSQGLSLNSEELRSILDKLIQLGILVVSSESELEGTTLSFFVDTYLEFFYARAIATDFINNPDDFRFNINLSNYKYYEMLKLVIELISYHKFSGNKKDSISRKFVQKIYDLGRDIELIPSEDDIRLPKLNIYLSLLVYIVSNLKPNNSDDKPNAYQQVDIWVLNAMVMCRYKLPTPKITAPNVDTEYIFDLLAAARTISSPRIFHEIFSPYWMALLNLVSPNEFNVVFRGNRSFSSLAQRCFVNNCNDVMSLYNFTHSIYLDYVKLHPQSAIRIRNFLVKLFINQKKYTQKELYHYIIKWYKDNDNDVYLKEDARNLLFCINDIDFILDNYEQCKGDYVIEWNYLRKLISNCDEKIDERIIFTEEFFDKMRYKEDMALYLFRYYIFRNNFSRHMMSFLFDGRGKKYISDDNFRTLLDLFPISKIPEKVALEIYDSEIYEYLKNQSDNDNSEEGIAYRFFEADDSTLKVSIKDISTSLDGLMAVFTSNDDIATKSVISDEYIDTETYTYTLESQNGDLIPRSGLITTNNGDSVMYSHSDSDFKINVTFCSRNQINILESVVNNKENVMVEGIECSIQRLMQTTMKTFRVLAFNNTSSNPLPRCYGNLIFYRSEDMEHAIILDRTLRKENYYKDDRFFQTTRIVSNHLEPINYNVLGYTKNKIQVVTDKLLSPEKYKDKIAEVTGKGFKSTYRVLSCCDMTEPYIELAFRLYASIDIPPHGSIKVKSTEYGTESISYVFCMRDKRNVVVRITNPKVVAKISDEASKARYLNKKTVFRCSNILLIYGIILQSAKNKKFMRKVQERGNELATVLISTYLRDLH